MSIEQIRRRIDKLAASIPIPEQQSDTHEEFDRSLYSAQELQELDALLEQIAPKIQAAPHDNRMYELLTDVELETLERWGKLNEARKERHLESDRSIAVS